MVTMAALKVCSGSSPSQATGLFDDDHGEDDGAQDEIEQSDAVAAVDDTRSHHTIVV
jgi:hypothetical protein